MTAPVFNHDCDACTFVGHADGHDHYVCGDSLIARDGHDGWEYVSSPRFIVSQVVAADPGYILGLTAVLAARRGL